MENIEVTVMKSTKGKLATFGLALIEPFRYILAHIIMRLLIDPDRTAVTNRIFAVCKP